MTTLVAQDFTSFIFANGEELKTTSLKIAEAFGKTHAHVLRDIEKVITQVSDIFGKTNFGLSEYEQANNLGIMTSYKMYDLTKDGFIMVVMSYTGTKAFAIKEAYINAFNLMHAKLFPKHATISQTPSGLPELLSANLTPLKKIMMLTLASHADENGQVQIGIHDLANICGIAKSTTCESVNGLEKAGFLSVIKTRCVSGGSLPNTYVIPERFRVVSGELVDEAPVALEYMPPEGMVLVAENELESLRHKANSKTAQQPIAPEGYAVVPLDFIKKYEERGKIIDNVRFYINA